MDYFNNTLAGKLRSKSKYDISKTLYLILKSSNITPFKATDQYICFYCADRFKKCTDLIVHNNTVHKKFDFKLAMQFKLDAKSTKFDVTNLTCKICNKLYNYKDFIDHAINTHKLDIDKKIANDFYVFKLTDENIACYDCGEHFGESFSNLLKHVHAKHIKEAFPCHVCGTAFVSKQRVNSHVSLVHSKIPRTCLKCNETLSSEADYRYHCAKFHRKDGLICSVCSKVFTSTYVRKQHIAFVHDIKSQQFKCESCPKVYCDSNRLRTHVLRVHLKQRRFSCNKCEFQGYYKKDLDDHAFMHTNVRPYQCDYCMKTFSRRKTIVNHLETHFNVRKYKCEECGKAFAQAATLYSHKKVHR